MTDYDVSRLYSRYAGIYALISRDRDFVAENQAVLDIAGQTGGFRENHSLKVLELCAGPAEHGQDWRARGADVWAVDASDEMKDVAVSSGACDERQYAVASLPDFGAASDERNFDLATIMRYSVGYLSRPDLVATVRALTGMLRPGGLLFLELHRLDWIRSDLTDMSIRERSLVGEDGRKHSIIWPDGPIAWGEDDWTASMPLRVVVDGETEASLVSTELIYSERELEFLVESNTDFRRVPLPGTAGEVFTQSTPIAFVLEPRP